MKEVQEDIATLSTATGAGAPPALDKRELLEMYRQMVLCRTLDERVWMLNRQGKAAIVASAQGHEAGQIGSVWALRKGRDQFYIYYRDLAVVLSLGMTPREIMLGFLAKEGEPLSAARQFPVHGAYPKHNIVNLSNVVATQIPQAVGAALASKMRGDDTVIIVYFGDGAASVGDCHEGMNFAAIHKLPVVFFCENNGYAISVPLSKQMAVESIAARAVGYGMPGISIDGTDIVAVYDATAEAAARARDGLGPTLIEAMVERYLPHTSDDNDRLYRTEEDIEEARKRDPLKILRGRLIGLGHLTEQLDDKLHADARREVDEATEFVEAASYPGTEGFYDHVYASSPDMLSETSFPEGDGPPPFTGSGGAPSQ
jgi:2-oxoisovalerate dehydrogenase E1 component alpha subunit